MVEHARAAIRYLGDATVEDLVRDDAKLSAILWRVTIVGEAAAHLTDEGRARAMRLPLREAKRMRNLIVHDYPEIDVGTVVRTVREDMPRLIDSLERLLEGSLE